MPVSGATAAIQASPGCFVSGEGQTACQTAAPGTFVAGSGATISALAPPGFFVPTSGATAATLAPPGFFVPQSGQSAAISAPVGSFVPGFGAIEALSCGAGSFSYGGSSACRDGGAGPGENIVSPEFDIAGLSGTDSRIMSGDSLSFEITNSADFIGDDDPLTALTILDVSIIGDDLGLFAITGFDDPMVLFEGDQLALLIERLGQAPNGYSFTVSILTDVGADFGSAGQVFEFAVEYQIPITASWALLLTGAYGLRSLTARRRSS